MRLMRPIIGLCLLVFSVVTQAAAPNMAEMSKRFDFLGLTISQVKPSEMQGVYEVTTDQGLFFANEDGSYFIQGKLYSVGANGEFADVLTQRYAKQVDKFASQMIVYPAKDEKYVINVFTDTTCGYCVKLHNQMDEYNDLGITVRYLAYPRQGPMSKVSMDMAKVWCADDRAKALDAAKRGASFDYDESKLAQCQKTIYDEYQYGRQLGINGTPAILIPNGQLVPGYVPPQELLKALQEG
ncbi:MAG: bifunctional protein-disulfide isomerase/oxidoreductase DsbC [Vibrio sp.]